MRIVLPPSLSCEPSGNRSRPAMVSFVCFGIQGYRGNQSRPLDKILAPDSPCFLCPFPCSACSARGCKNTCLTRQSRVLLETPPMGPRCPCVSVYFLFPAPSTIHERAPSEVVHVRCEMRDFPIPLPSHAAAVLQGCIVLDSCGMSLDSACHFTLDTVSRDVGCLKVGLQLTVPPEVLPGCAIRLLREYRPTSKERFIPVQSMHRCI